MKENRNGLLDKIKVNGSMKSPDGFGGGLKVEFNGVKFFSPVEAFHLYILGEGDKRDKVRVDDERYNQIKEWIQKNVMPYLDVKGRKLCSTYGLKHFIEYNIGGYVSNETVKVIMCELGAKKRRVMHGEEYPINLFYSYNGIMGVELYERR